MVVARYTQEAGYGGRGEVRPQASDFQRQEAIKRWTAGETLASIAKSYAVDLSMIFATSGLTPLDDRDADPVRYRQVVQRLLCHDQPAGEYLNRSIS